MTPPRLVLHDQDAITREAAEFDALLPPVGEVDLMKADRIAQAFGFVVVPLSSPHAGITPRLYLSVDTHQALFWVTGTPSATPVRLTRWAKALKRPKRPLTTP